MLNEKPVFLFTGFLGAGKTEFIQDTLQNPEFGKDGRTLLVICEEGELEYEPEKFSGPGAEIRYISSEEELLDGVLLKFASECKFDRVVIEYNGMWPMESLYMKMPRSWVIAQETCFFDASTFEIYNKNMRQQSFDKMKTADIVVFNRFDKEADKMPFHKEVRVANRRSLILYEYSPNDMEPDTIEDPLPYDLNEKEITIEDDWYAEWYRDINENEANYDGKIITLKGRVAINKALNDGRFAFGRHLMTCCVEDIEFAALMAVWIDTSGLESGDWVKITAEVRVEYEEAYLEEGPVLHITKLEACEPTDPEVASF